MKQLRLILTYFVSYFSIACFSQPINLDRPVKAGELTCFPDIGNEKLYYYISDKPHLAMNSQNKPQFSFLMYTEKAKESDADQGKEDTDGGGIVHAVVELSVTADQLSEAKRELQRLKPSAELVGPVVFKSGRFGIVSSFKNPQGDLVQQVVGLGNAPILDGQKAAVSIQLTKKGALILWNSFFSSTPDISFTFEMDVSGYRSPKKALIEANFDQIYDHKAFNVGIATSYLAAEIKGAFDDLRRSGAIKVTQTGEDEKMEAMISTAYNKITEMMFSPLNGTGNLGVNELGSITGGSGTGVLDRATNMLKDAKKEAQEQKKAKPEVNSTPEEKNKNASSTLSKNDKLPPDSRVSDNSPSVDKNPASAKAADVKDIPKDNSGAGFDATSQRNNGSTENSTNNSSNQKSSTPTFAIVAMFEMKKIRQQGKFTIDLNKSIADHISMRFDENIGDLKKHLNDKRIFSRVSLDDPLYIQREILVSLDGATANDFKEYINSVNVRLKKVHQSRDITNQEVTINKANFNSEGNKFRMVYGWKGDNDRNKWLDYEYEIEWSFFGGHKIIIPMQKAKGQQIVVAPPFEKRSVEFFADADKLNDQNVRLVTVNLFYKLGSKEFQKEITLVPSRQRLSEIIDFMLPSDSSEFEYEITWIFKNNQTKTSGRLKGNKSKIPVDFIQ